MGGSGVGIVWRRQYIEEKKGLVPRTITWEIREPCGKREVTYIH